MPMKRFKSLKAVFMPLPARSSYCMMCSCSPGKFSTQAFKRGAYRTLLSSAYQWPKQQQGGLGAQAGHAKLAVRRMIEEEAVTRSSRGHRQQRTAEQAPGEWKAGLHSMRSKGAYPSWL
jgi:hypothetical protein